MSKRRGIALRVIVDGAEWPALALGCVVSTALVCPGCGRYLAVEVPDDDEGDAVCEHCGARVGRVVRL